MLAWTGSYSAAFYILAGVMLVSAIVPVIVRPPKAEQSMGVDASAAPAR